MTFKTTPALDGVWVKDIESDRESFVRGTVLMDPETNKPYAAGGGTVHQHYSKKKALLDELSQFSFDIAPGDFVTRTSTSNGQVALAISADPLTPDTLSMVTMNKSVGVPHYMEIEASLSQRTKGIFTVVELFRDADTGRTPPMAPNSVVRACQSNAAFTFSGAPTAGAFLTIELAEPFGGMLSDWINIYGFADSRLNYANLCVAGMNVTRTILYCTVADEATLPTLAIATVTPPANSVFIQHYTNMNGAEDGYAMRFTGSSATSASYVSLFGGNDAQISGTLIGNHLVTCASTAPVITAGLSSGIPEIKASSRYLFELRPNFAYMGDYPVDSMVGSYATRQRRSGVKPAWDRELTPRLRVRCPSSISRPVAKIVSVARAANVATVTTAQAHGLVTGNYVTIKGVFNQTLFANSTQAAVTVTGANTFTVAWTGTDGTSYGGAVVINNGGVDQQGLLVPVQSVTTDLSAQTVALVGATSWTGVSVGEYVNLYGVRNSTTGADLGVDGVFMVSDMQTTTLTLVPVTDVFGVSLSPALPSLAAVPASGAVILRTTLRVTDINLESFTDVEVNISGQGTDDPARAIPVRAISSVTVNQSSAVALSSTDGSGAWYVRPGIVGITDVTSAALTSTANTASTGNALGNAYQVVIPVTAVTGTTPTLDVMIQESDDGGTNWIDIYQFPRITAAGVYRSPGLPSLGRHIRYVQTVAGTTPSFTRSVTRTLWPLQIAKPTRRRIDYGLAVNTINSTTGVLLADPCNNVQLILAMGAITTTAPVVTLQGSEDGSNWYGIDGASVTAVANSTVQATVANISATFVRAFVTTAGSGATLKYAMVKAWS